MKIKNILFGILSIIALLGCDSLRQTERPPEIDVNSSPILVVPPTPTPAFKPTQVQDAGLDVASTVIVTQSVSPISAIELSDWTILVYMDADNNLESYGISDLAEMRGALAALPDSAEIQLAVQIDRSAAYVVDELEDWSDTRRYASRNGDLELVESIGETNMGAPETLTDFVAWGMSSYPAEKTALIMWGHGVGWQGIAWDQDDGVPDSRPGRMRSAEIGSAIQTGLSRINHEKPLDLIGFDACLMGQLEVFTALGDVANYAVASEELIPGSGLNYGSMLAALGAQPDQSGQQLATTLVETYVSEYTMAGNEGVALAAVDLGKMDALLATVDALAAALSSDVSLSANTISDARGGGETFASYFATLQDRYASIDLGRFASLVVQLSRNEATRAAGQAVMLALDEAVVSAEHGSDLNYATGVAVYFPRFGRFYQPDYAQQTSLPEWNTLLTSYHALDVSSPTVSIAASSAVTEAINVQNPLWLNWDVAGRLIEQVAFFAGVALGDGTIQLLEYDLLDPEPTTLSDGSQLHKWRDGFHEDFFVWNGTVTWLSDGQQEAPVVMLPIAQDSTRYAVSGTYIAADGSEPIEASVVFDLALEERVAVWGGDIASPAEIVVQAGDQFEVSNWLLDADGALVSAAGERFALDQLSYSWRSVPDGKYAGGFSAESITGASSTDQINITIDNNALSENGRAYLDPYLGFQFTYPEEWLSPVYGEFGDTLLYTSSAAGDVSFQLKLYRDEAVSAESLQADVFAQWENVAVVYEDEVTVATQPGKRAIYSYQGVDGWRSGVLLVFERDGVGYALDIDMPQEREDELLQLSDRLAASWQFRPIGIGGETRRYATIEQGERSVVVPDGFGWEALDSGWDRYMDPAASERFFAGRRDRLSGRDTASLAVTWLAVAGGDANDVTTSPPDAQALAGYLWTRYDFNYVNAAGVAIRGLLLATVADTEQVVWAEAPVDEWGTFEQTVLVWASAEFGR